MGRPHFESNVVLDLVLFEALRFIGRQSRHIIWAISLPVYGYSSSNANHCNLQVGLEQLWLASTEPPVNEGEPFICYFIIM